MSPTQKSLREAIFRGGLNQLPQSHKGPKKRSQSGGAVKSSRKKKKQSNDTNDHRSNGGRISNQLEEEGGVGSDNYSGVHEYL